MDSRCIGISDESYTPGSRAFEELRLESGASGCVAGFDTRNNLLTQKLLGQGCWYQGLRRVFSGFYGRCCGLVSGFQFGVGSLLCQGFRSLGSMVTWCVSWGRLLVLIICRRSSLRWFPIIKGLAVALICCGGLRAWWLSWSCLAALGSSLIARR